MVENTPRRIYRDRPLTEEEKQRLRRIRAEEEADRSPSPRFAAMIEANEVAKLLRSARESSGLTLEDMAERTGMTAPALSRLESGSRENPSIVTIGRYAAALGLRVRLELVED